jgi:aspartyl-tRNA(Asn)/glutamyl-tRNA(Gln) amidotransferase subunit A
MNLAEASRAIASRSLSAETLLDTMLDRIERLDDVVHAYVHVAADAARAAARGADAALARGVYLGPLHGIPYAVKDNYETADLPTQAGSRLRQGRIGTTDAALVAQSTAAGAVLVGKLSTWEYGTGNGGEYFDLPFPPARNPWNLAHFSGGSSTGAGVAVACGEALFTMGSDTTGSVRLPAAATGVVGIKPTQGLLSTAGILPNCWSMDVPGPFAWTVEDLAIVLDALGTTACRPLLSHGVRGLRIGVVSNLGAGIANPEPAMAAAFDNAVAVLRNLGAITEATMLPIPVATCHACTSMIGPAESASIHEAELRERPEMMGFALRDKLLVGSQIRAADYLAAQRTRRQIADAVDAMICRYDAVVTFGPLHAAPRLGVEPEMTAFTVDTVMTPFNLSGHPALVQCTGFDAAGLPLSWQVVGRRFDEATVLRVAAAYEAATPWREQRPDPIRAAGDAT